MELVDSDLCSFAHEEDFFREEKRILVVRSVRVASLGSEENWSLFCEVGLFSQQKKPCLVDDSTSPVIATARKISAENLGFVSRDFTEMHLLKVPTTVQDNIFISCKSIALVPFNDALATSPHHLTFITARLPES